MEFCLRVSYIVSKEVKSLLIGFKHNSAIELQDIHFAMFGVMSCGAKAADVIRNTRDTSRYFAP